MLQKDWNGLSPVVADAAMPGLRQEGEEENADHADEQDADGHAADAAGGVVAVSVAAVRAPSAATVDDFLLFGGSGADAIEKARRRAWAQMGHGEFASGLGFWQVGQRLMVLRDRVLLRSRRGAWLKLKRLLPCIAG